jgi:hypothetical protein
VVAEALREVALQVQCDADATRLELRAERGR